MPYCVNCGKPSDRKRSFNWTNGIRYLCSDECVKMSKPWRLAKYN